MKTRSLITLILGLAASAFAQGTIYLHNAFNHYINPSPYADSYGVVFVYSSCEGFLPITQDVNLSVYGGIDSNNLLLLRTVAGPAAVGDVIPEQPGVFEVESSPFFVTIPGTLGTNRAVFRIDFWLGSAPNYAMADGSQKGTSGVFSNVIGYPPDGDP